MQIFCLHSNSAIVKLRETLYIVTAAIPFYEQLFGDPFLFEKYDNTFCPESRFRGMKNLGTTSFKDAFLLPLDEQKPFTV